MTDPREKKRRGRNWEKATDRGKQKFVALQQWQHPFPISHPSLLLEASLLLLLLLLLFCFLIFLLVQYSFTAITSPEASASAMPAIEDTGLCWFGLWLPRLGLAWKRP